MTAELRFDVEAEEELQAAVAWYEDKAAGLGRRFLQAVETTLELVGKFPSTGHAVAGVRLELGVRQRSVWRFPYSVVYLELESEIRVLAIAHHRRRPGYWRDRIEAG